MKSIEMSAPTVGCPVEAGGAPGCSTSAKVERNRAAMRLFEKCINTNDLELGRRLVSEKAAFDTPVSPTPLYGADESLHGDGGLWVWLAKESRRGSSRHLRPLWQRG